MDRSTPFVSIQWIVAIGSGLIVTLVLTVAPSKTLLIVFGLIALAMVFMFLVNWYWIVLSYRDSAPNSKARMAYNRLRNNLRGIHMPMDTPFGVRYRMVVTDSLDTVARFYGDPHYPNSERLCRRLGISGRKSLWTAASYDRCLLLALVYPLASVILIWLIAGTVGPAEQSIGLAALQSPWVRVSWFIGLLLIAFLFRQLLQSTGAKSVAWLFAFAIGVVCDFGFAFAHAIRIVRTGAGVDAVAVADAVAVGIVCAVIIVCVILSASSNTGASSGASASSGAVSGVVAGAVAIAFAFAFSSTTAAGVPGALARPFDITFFIAVPFAITISFAICIAIGVSVSVKIVFQKTSHREGTWFYICYSLLMLVTVAITTQQLSSTETWDVIGPFLLFFGVLVFINAPLDWLTLGVTRALLWRGLEQRGLSPVLFGLLDILFAVFLLVLVSIAMVAGIQIFNALVVLGGGKIFLDPTDLLIGIANPITRGNVEYWWVYFTLFSTLIPSWLHLLVASGCLVRGSTRLNRLIGQDIPFGKEGESILPHTQTKLAVLLALQGTLGIALTTVVFFGGLYALFIVVPPQIIPQLFAIAVPIAEGDWATGFVNTVSLTLSSLFGILR